MRNTLNAYFETVTATSDAPLRFFDADTIVAETTWRQMIERARGRAAALQNLGIGRNSRVAVLGFTGADMIETLFATWLAGATVTMLPLPMRLGSVDAFLAATRARIASAQANVLVLDDFFAEQYTPSAGDPRTVTMAELHADAAEFRRVDVDPSDLAILQFTSGSTNAPKAVRLPHGAVLANVLAIIDGLRANADDIGVNWLPLYHDMGLIGTLLVPAVFGFENNLAAPQHFLGRPAMWMEWVSKLRGTITTAPNFAYALAARGLKREPDGALDLSRLRVALCGAEPIAPATFDKFLDAGARFGLDPNVVLPCYGLAESTLAVTFTPLDAPMRIDIVDRKLLEHGDEARPVDLELADDGADVKAVVGLGTPLRGLAVRIVDDAGLDVPERHVGEIEVAGSSLFDGYDRHPEATAAAMTNGWLHTGDYGYFADGDLFVCGRKKDLIIVGGRNIWPEDVEAAAVAIDGIRLGNCIAFGVERKGKEALVVVAETTLAADPAGAAAAADAVAVAVRETIGMSPKQVVLIGVGELPKTSSGKLQRSLTKQHYLDGELGVVATHGSGA